jgi:hypothetical protein
MRGPHYALYKYAFRKKSGSPKPVEREHFLGMRIPTELSRVRLLARRAFHYTTLHDVIPVGLCRERKRGTAERREVSAEAHTVP